MARLLKLIIALVVVIAAMFFLSGIDSRKPIERIEKPVEIDATTPSEN